MKEYRADFESMDWETPISGVRHKVLIQSGMRLRLVEYFPSMTPHWCERGHVGYILAGRLEVEFPDCVQVFEPGNGVCIPAGPNAKHRARVLTDVVRAFFVEDV